MVDLSIIQNIRKRRVKSLKASEKQSLELCTAFSDHVDHCQQEINTFKEQTKNIEIEFLEQLVCKRITMLDIHQMNKALKQLEEEAQVLVDNLEKAKSDYKDQQQIAHSLSLEVSEAERKEQKLEEIQVFLKEEEKKQAVVLEDKESDETIDVISALSRFRD